MKRRTSKLLAFILSACLLMSMFSVMGVLSSSADSYGSETLFSFSAESAGEGSAIGGLSFTDDGTLTLTSNGEPQDYSKGEYIKQAFSIGNSESVVATVQSDRAKNRIATNVTLSTCTCIFEFSDNPVKSVEVQLMLYGKDASGNQLVTKTSAYMKEGDTRTVIFDIPERMVSADTLVICFENNISGMVDTAKKECGPKDIVADFTSLKLYTVENGVASSTAAAGCVYDWSETDAYAMLGSGPLIRDAGVQFKHDAASLYPVGAMNIASNESYAKFHPQEWQWEDTGIKVYPKQGAFNGYDGMSMYILVDKDEQFIKWDYPEYSIAPFSMTIQCKVPARDESGNFLNEDDEVVSTMEEAYIDVAYFKINEIGVSNDKYTATTANAITAGTPYKLDVNFSSLAQTTPWPQHDLWEWDSLGDDYPDGTKLSDYISLVSLGRAAMANDCYVNYTVSDIYGMNNGVSTLPAITPVPTTTTTTPTKAPTTTTTNNPDPVGAKEAILSFNTTGRNYSDCWGMATEWSGGTSNGNGANMKNGLVSSADGNLLVLTPNGTTAKMIQQQLWGDQSKNAQNAYKKAIAALGSDTTGKKLQFTVTNSSAANSLKFGFKLTCPGGVGTFNYNTNDTQFVVKKGETKEITLDLPDGKTFPATMASGSDTYDAALSFEFNAVSLNSDESGWTKGDINAVVSPIYLVSGEAPETTTTTTTTTTVKPPVLSGDANNDGVVNVLDLIRIKRYIADKSVAINTENADVNGDGAVNAIDVYALLDRLCDPSK